MILFFLLLCSCNERTKDREPLPSKTPSNIQKNSDSANTKENSQKQTKPIKVEFKLLTDYDLPLADQTIAEKQDLKELNNAIPPEVKKLNNKRILIKGFMVPLALNEDNLISTFLFAPDQNSCCFGNIPNLNGFIYCTSKVGIPNLKDILLKIDGNFKSIPEYNVFDEAVYLYTMKVESYEEMSLKIPATSPGFDF
jgi:hypothetical protein